MLFGYLTQFQFCPSGLPNSFKVSSNESTSDLVPQNGSDTPVVDSVQVVQISFPQLEINSMLRIKM